MLRLTKEQNEKIDKLLDKKVTQKGHFLTLGDAARLIKEKLGKPEQELEEHQGEQPLETRKQLSMRQVKQLHTGVRSQWRRPKVGKRGSVKPKGTKIRKNPAVFSV